MLYESPRIGGSRHGFAASHSAERCALQAALATVQAYPYTVDVPALAEAAALELGEPPAPALLSGGG